MNTDTKATFFAGLIITGCIVCLWLLSALWNSYTCVARWDGSQQETKYGIIQGCQVETAPKSGRFVPEKSLRNTAE